MVKTGPSSRISTKPSSISVLRSAGITGDIFKRFALISRSVHRRPIARSRPNCVKGLSSVICCTPEIGINLSVNRNQPATKRINPNERNKKTNAMYTATPVSLIFLVAMAAGLAACSQEPDYSDQERACIAQRYKVFDARNLNQCIDVCKACMHGNNVTCNTSCKLKGAS